MKPTLGFSTMKLHVGELGDESPLPDLLGSFNIQNKTDFFLDEDDEIFEGYGKLTNGYPYRQYNCYSRTLHERETKVAVLENDYLRAVFLPEMGGRLWSLVDKLTDQNLLYTNDVIRPSNLAIRNAWFSGGVEWNISMIGHSPLTCEPLFTALTADEHGNPVLRMYEYERVRDVEYQMDFWLGEQDRFLNCRMRIVNSTARVVPMYWWSNMAVPEYEDGRVVVPADTAYTNRPDGIYKVSVPMVDGVDISHYKEIPDQIDYFFNIPLDSDKYIANLNAEGYGLLHVSTSRLQSRKLFSWGNNGASDSWQDFLTDKAGRYVEIQAGLGKTQYGCVPMPPHTAWEWLERYGAVNVGADAATQPASKLRSKLGAIAAAELTVHAADEQLTATRGWAKQKATLVHKGSGYGALANLCRTAVGERTLSAHLDWGMPQQRQLPWVQLLVEGSLPEPTDGAIPGDYTATPVLAKRLLAYASGDGKASWYAQYQAGIYQLYCGEVAVATKHLRAAQKLKETPWAHHGLAVIAMQEGKPKAAATAMMAGLKLLPRDLAYLKEAFRIMLAAGYNKELVAHYNALTKALQKESRLKFCYITALCRTGKVQQAWELLTAGSGLVLDDLRECEDSVGALWQEIHTALFGGKGELPPQFNFDSTLK